MMGGWGYGYNNMMSGGWLGGLLLLLFGALVVAGIVVLILWAVRQSSGNGAADGSSRPSSGMGHDEAIAIARRRLANGEITKEEYDELIRVLG